MCNKQSCNLFLIFCVPCGSLKCLFLALMARFKVMISLYTKPSKHIANNQCNSFLSLFSCHRTKAWAASRYCDSTPPIVLQLLLMHIWASAGDKGNDEGSIFSTAAVAPVVAMAHSPVSYWISFFSQQRCSPASEIKNNARGN